MPRMDWFADFFRPVDALDVARVAVALGRAAPVESANALLEDDGGAWRYLDSPCPLVHPALAPRLAELARLSERELWTLVRERGARWLLRRLRWRRRLAGGLRAADLLIRRVPVPPLARRPLERMPGGRLMPGPDNLLLLDVARWIDRARLVREGGYDDDA